MSEVNQSELIPFDQKFGELCSRYHKVSHKASITFGEEGESLQQEQERTFDEICSLAAGQVIGAEPVRRSGVLDTILTSLRASAPISGRLPDSMSTQFIKRTLLKAVELAEAKK